MRIGTALVEFAPVAPAKLPCQMPYFRTHELLLFRQRKVHYHPFRPVSPIPVSCWSVDLGALPAPVLDALWHNLDHEAVAPRQLAFTILDVFVLQQQQGTLPFWATF